MYQPLLPSNGVDVTIGDKTHRISNIGASTDPNTGRITAAAAYSHTTREWIDLVPWLERDRLSLDAAHTDARTQVDSFAPSPGLPVFWPTWPEYRAGCIGADHGRAAASHLFDGNTTTETYRAFAAGLADGDPEYLDRIPVPDLSGQWADGYTPTQLAQDATGSDAPTRENDWTLDALCDVYEQAFTRAAQDAAERVCRAHLQDENTTTS